MQRGLFCTNRVRFLDRSVTTFSSLPFLFVTFFFLISLLCLFGEMTERNHPGGYLFEILSAKVIDTPSRTHASSRVFGARVFSSIYKAKSIPIVH
jgi:hypothetical protein